MILSIHDFPLKFEDNCIKNCKDKIILDFSKKIKKEKFVQFILDSLPAINDGKRIYKKRLTKTFDKSLKDSIDIIKQEMFEQGFVVTKEIGDIEYNIITKEGNQIVKFIKISNMEENKKDVKENLEELLIKVLDAKEQKFLTEKNKEIALTDLLKLLNYYWDNIKKDISKKGLLNKHQEIWSSAINSANKKIKFPLININSGLFRCYIITLFCSINKEDILKYLTNWSISILEKEKITLDMRLLFLSINKVIQNKEKMNLNPNTETENDINKN